jgi:hypothetical protein
MGETWSLTCFDPATGDTQLFDDSNYVVSLVISADNAKDGTYDIGFSRFHVVEQANELIGDIVEFDAKVIPGKLIIGDGGTTDEPTTAPTTKPTQGGPTQKDFIVKGSTVEYKKGEKNYMDFFTESNGHKGNMVVFEIGDLPAGVTATVDPVSKAFANKPKWSVMGETWSLTCFDPATGDTQLFDDSNYVVSLVISADDAKPGEYEIGFKRFHVVEQANELIGDIVEFDATIVPGKLIIPPVGGTTTTTAPTTAPTTVTTTPPTTDALYGDTNCDGKVNIADVVVLNKWLNDNSAYAMTAQGKINADCCDAKAGTPDENDSKAIIQSLVHLVKISDGKCTAADLK